MSRIKKWIATCNQGPLFFIVTLVLVYSSQELLAIPSHSPTPQEEENISLMPEEEFNTLTESTVTESTVTESTAPTQPGTPSRGVEPDQPQPQASTVFTPRRIRNIIIQGSTLKSAILSKVPYRPGEIFKPTKAAQLIRAVYELGLFLPTIQVKACNVSPTEVDIYIIVQEKPKIEDIVFKGLVHLKREDIEKELKISEIRALTQEDLERLAQAIKKLYAAKDYHNVQITPELRLVGDNRAIAEFTIEEGPRFIVKRVFFTGNTTIPGSELRTIIFTREDWLFGFLDKSGSYQPDALEIDKRIIENYYQSRGFLTARVANVIVDIEPETYYVTVTFVISEGDLYTVTNIAAPGNDILTQEQILTNIDIRPGDLYSKEQIREAIERLRLLWGEYGYVYADIEPIIEPNRQDKTVSITFNSDLGSKVNVNRIIITGNKKTRDNVIRREVTLNEGELLTTQKLDDSQRRVEQLGYFEERTGVEWKIRRLNEELADLELIVKEIRTGKGYIQFGFGGLDEDIQSPSRSFNIGAGIQDSSFLGTGLKYNFNVVYSRQDIGVDLTIADQFIFDRPIGAGINVFHRSSNYDEFKNVKSTPKERITGGVATMSFVPQRFFASRVLFDLGAENISYDNKIITELRDANRRLAQEFQEIVNRRFQPGTLLWLGNTLIQDYRNHPTYPSKGYQWASYTKVGIPHGVGTFGFFKWEGDAHWYTPLIEDYDLILHLHGHAGFVRRFPGNTIPYRELFHIGGVSSVRGYLFGQIGPQINCDSIGAQNAFFVNAELLFPITKDGNVRGVLFYDGGAGWDTPDAHRISRDLLRNNRFNYRQSIGIGIRLTNPTPLRVDVGFKLDRNRRRGESPYEVHFTSALVEF